VSLVISSLTTEYVRVRLTGQNNGVEIDPTSFTVQLAFPAQGVDPVSGDWATGAWETVTDSLNNRQYWAKLLVGPAGSKNLAKGRYDVWIKVLASPETPVVNAGQLIIN